MNKKNSLETTDKKWNPVTGCTKISEGCVNCYAERMATGWLQGFNNARYKNGFELTLHHDLIEQPLHWRKSRTVFVCGMSDFFHDGIPDEFIVKMFEVMKKSPQHRFLFTTKRSERLRKMDSEGLLEWCDNIWAGVTVENMKRRNRIDDLLSTGAHLKYLLVEPLLEEVDLSQSLKNIDWVVCGGESGPKARPCEVEWVRKVRDDCITAGVPLYFKQWGGNARKKAGNELDGKFWHEYPEV